MLGFQVPPVLVQKIFTQTFQYVNVQLFNRWLPFFLFKKKIKSLNPSLHFSLWGSLILTEFIMSSLLLRRECCTFSNGEYVKAGLAELELWCCQAKDEVICVNNKAISTCFCAATDHIFHPLLNYSRVPVCRLRLGWTQTHKTSCWILG